MKARLIVCMMCLLVAGSGCAVLRQGALDISKEEMKNAATARIVAKNYLSITAIQVGMLRGALGERINELPKTAVDAVDELSELATLDPNSLTDEQLGMSLGLRIRLLCSVVREALEIYAPDLLIYLIL